ncbi:hypothetical protein G9A89_016106 [Geosiphon pyriformis]|nr:hypothetical protein G9A89_016106 [Geosiphon pyriformis]
MHIDPLAGHFEKTKTIQKTLTRYYWPTLEKDIAKYIKTCDICQKKSKPNHKKDIHPISVAKTSKETNLWDKVLLSALFAYRTVNHDITSYKLFYLLYGCMATLPIETDIETIPFEEITIGNYKDILQKRLGTILDSLIEARIIAFEKIKQFQEKLKKKKPIKHFF